MNGQYIGEIPIIGCMLDEEDFHYIFNRLYSEKSKITARDVMLKDFAAGIEALFVSAPVNTSRKYILNCVAMATAEWLEKLPPRALAYIEDEPLALKAVGFLTSAKHVLKPQKVAKLTHKMYDRRAEIGTMKSECEVIVHKMGPLTEKQLDGISYAKLLRKYSLMTMLADILKNIQDTYHDEYGSYSDLGYSSCSDNLTANIRWLTRLTKVIPKECGVGNISYNKGLPLSTEDKYWAKFVDIFLDIFADPSRQPDARTYM